ncbi:MAG: GNAT family N-acetyltransferase [Halioglobus sp.]
MQAELNIQRYDGALTAPLLALLLSADPDEEQVRQYMSGATLLVATGGSDTAGVAVLTCEKHMFELKNIAVAPSCQGMGIAKRLITAIKQEAKERGAKHLLVGTGNSSLDQLALYQKCGFRMLSIEVDFFASYQPPIYENGLRCLDKVILCANIQE